MINSTQHAHLLRRASSAALLVALLLVVAKAIAWWQSGAVTLFAGLTDSLLDSAASLLNLLAVRYALRPADADHRYGYGKAEALAGLGQALFIAASAILVAVQALKRLQQPEAAHDIGLGLGIAVMLLSLLMTAALLLYQQHVVRLTGSTAIYADSLHYRSDLLLNSSIVLALVLSAYGWPSLDPVFALAIAGYIFYSAINILRQASAVLMDEALPKATNQHLQQLARSVSGVQGVRDLRSRTSGSHWFVQSELLLADSLSLREAHEICHQVEQLILQHYPRAEVLLHAEPAP